MNNIRQPDFSPLGKPIIGYEVLGGDLDEGAGREADVAVTVRPAAQFMCTVVTREWYAATVVGDSDFTQTTPEMFDGSAAYTPPFVVNDTVLTRGVLDRVFKGTVGPDLAPSLAPVDEG